MTIRMDAADLITAIEVASLVGTIVAMLVIGLLIYLMVRPSRRRRDRRQVEIDAADARQTLQLIERMERRLEVLERVVAQDAVREEQFLEAGEAPQKRRTQ